jgi:hypothetical protein
LISLVNLSLCRSTTDYATSDTICVLIQYVILVLFDKFIGLLPAIKSIVILHSLLRLPALRLLPLSSCGVAASPSGFIHCSNPGWRVRRRTPLSLWHGLCVGVFFWATVSTRGILRPRWILIFIATEIGTAEVVSEDLTEYRALQNHTIISRPRELDSKRCKLILPQLPLIFSAGVSNSR